MINVLRSTIFNFLFYLWAGTVVLASFPLLLFPRGIVLKLAEVAGWGFVILLRFIVSIKYEVRGQGHLIPPPAIVAIKHQSAWETLILYIILKNPAIILKQELSYIPLFGQFARKLGCISLDRKGSKKTIQTMLTKGQAVKTEGRYLALFPEGTRSLPGQRGHYFKGIALLYEHLALPVIPVALNSGLFWGRRKFLKQPGTIVIEFLPAIAPGLSKQDFMTTLENTIETASMRLCLEGNQTKEVITQDVQ